MVFKLCKSITKSQNKVMTIYAMYFIAFSIIFGKFMEQQQIFVALCKYSTEAFRYCKLIV